MEVEVAIVEKFCKGCGLCVAICPNGMIFLKEAVNEQGVNAAEIKDEHACKACMNCVLVCPDACIEIKK